MAAPELPRAGSGSPSRGDTWQPRSCPQPGGGSRCLDLKLARGGTRSSGYRQWPPGPPRERMRSRGWGQTSFPRAAFLSLYVLGFQSGGVSRLMCGDPRFTRTLRCSRNRHASQFLVGRYCSAEIAGPEVIMTMIPELMGLRAYGMHRDSVSAPFLHLLVVQRRLMSGAWTHLSASGYAEHTVCVRIHTPILLPFAPISFVFCTCFSPRSSTTVHHHGR
jgi:hypothetical protein